MNWTHLNSSETLEWLAGSLTALVSNPHGLRLAASLLNCRQTIEIIPCTGQGGVCALSLVADAEEQLFSVRQRNSAAVFLYNGHILSTAASCCPGPFARSARAELALSSASCQDSVSSRFLNCPGLGVFSTLTGQQWLTAL